MLSPRIREAVDTGKFGIYPVEHITEALELLTGIPAGKPLKNGGFTRDSLYESRRSPFAGVRPQRRARVFEAVEEKEEVGVGIATPLGEGRGNFL